MPATEPPAQPSAGSKVQRVRIIQSLFLWDVIRDEDSRPIFGYALAMLLFGTVVYHYLEGWSYLDALYFCVISVGTIGYGDLTPTSDVAKLFTIFYVINGIVILLSLFDRIRAVRATRLQSGKPASVTYDAQDSR